MSTATTASATQREPELRGQTVVDRRSAGIGLIAHTSVEATVRFAAELGYQVTVVKDATASYSNSDKEMHATLDVNVPDCASAIVTTEEVVDSISSLQT